MRTGCEECREAVSARLDGEEPPGEAAPVDAHLAGCAECREWAERAARVTRLTRTRVAEPEPDLVGRVLAATALARPGPPRRGGRARCVDPVRFALGGVGLAQLALGVSGVLATGSHIAHSGAAELGGATTVHFAHESAAWNLALGLGFLVAAATPRRGPGLLPVLGAFVVVLAGLSVLDVLAGRVDPGRLLGHGLVVAGLLLLVALRRLDGTGGGGTGRPRDDPAPTGVPHRSTVSHRSSPGPEDPLRPTGRAA